VDLDNSNLYINRELSWLKFNSRVLDQVNFKEYLPLDKLKFIAIYGTNLDEFYMIRVAGLKSLYKAGVYDASPDKLPPKEQLKLIREYLRNEIETLESSYLRVVKELQEQDLHIKRYNELNRDTKSRVDNTF